MQPVQDLTVEDRVSRTQFQYSIEDADAQELAQWTPKLVDKLRASPELARRRHRSAQRRPEDQSHHRPRYRVAHWGSFRQAIDNTLYDAFGQRLVSTIFTQLNQYHVVLEVLPSFAQDSRRDERHLRAPQQHNSELRGAHGECRHRHH